MPLDLLVTKNSNHWLRGLMEIHYSQPKGFVARNIVYAVFWDMVFYGYTVAGSCTRSLPKRNEFFGIDDAKLNNIVNNSFFHIERALTGKYPHRNFLPLIIKEWRKHVMVDWPKKYGDQVIGFETLVEPPRTGECYLRDGWTYISTTKGFTCKRTAGNGTDSWGGKRVWDKEHLRPKLVFVRKLVPNWKNAHTILRREN